MGYPGTCAKGEHALDSLLWAEEIFADLVDIFGLLFVGFAPYCSVEQAFACEQFGPESDGALWMLTQFFES